MSATIKEADGCERCMQMTDEIEMLKTEVRRMSAMNVTELMCVFCGVILDDDEVCKTKAGPACESCSDAHYSYDYGASKWPD